MAQFQQLSIRYTYMALGALLFSCSTNSSEDSPSSSSQNPTISSSQRDFSSHTLISSSSIVGSSNNPSQETLPEMKPTVRYEMSQAVFQGAFRLKNGDYGVSNINYAIGTLAYNPSNHSLFIAGHDHHQGVAEYPIIAGKKADDVAELPETPAPLQDFVSFFDQVENPNGVNRITGLFVYKNALLINGENWYDAGGTNTSTTLVVENANDLTGKVKGFFELEGAAHSAGYMGAIPEPWKEAFGAEVYTGWSSVYSITSRYSIGPSLWTFDAEKTLSQNPEEDPILPAHAFMNYAFGGTHLSPTALEWGAQGEPGPFEPASPLWNQLSKGMYGFFVPGTKTFAVVGSSAGLSSGIGYKAVQSDGYQCGGPCPFDPADQSNYYWLYDVEEILSASNVFEPQPYDYGKWELPHDENGKHQIIGATLNPEAKTLYVAIENAGQVGDYDRPPLLLEFKL